MPKKLGLSAALTLLLVTATPFPAGASASPSRDPAVGPHTWEEQGHAGPVQLEPARTAVLGRSAAAPAAQALTREVFGFATYYMLSSYPSWDFSLLSTIAYFGLDVNSDGNFNRSTPGWNGWNSQALVDIINRAHQAGARVVLTIKAFDNPTINAIVTSPTATQTAINATIDAIAAKRLDGVNVDFEGSSSPLYPDIQKGFTSFMTALYAQVHARWPDAFVTADTYSGSASWDGGIFNIGALDPVVDAFFLMDYDMGLANDPTRALPNSPMNGWTWNVTTSVAQYLTKTSPGKVILGVPYYGYKWSTTTSQQYSPVRSAATARTYAGVLEDFACARPSRAWDSTGQSPWAWWWSPASGDPCGGNFNSWRQLHYDDATSLGLKYDLVNANNLAGAGIWALGYDGSSPDLWRVLANKFVPQQEASPAASSWGFGHLDLFTLGKDDAVWHRAYDRAGGGWSIWESLGGQLLSGPAAASWGSQRVDVFARGSDNALWHQSYDVGDWSGWESLGGNLGSAPGVSSWAVGRLDVFALDPDGALSYRWYDLSGGGWSAWESLGGQLTTGPSAVSWGFGRVDVFARGSDNTLWHRWYDRQGAGWSAPESLGGNLTSEPRVSSWGFGRLDVFARGPDGALWHRWYDRSGAGWSGWESLGGQLASGAGAASWGSGRVDVFGRGVDGSVQHRWYDGGSWSLWESIPGE